MNAASELEIKKAYSEAAPKIKKKTQMPKWRKN